MARAQFFPLLLPVPFFYYKWHLVCTLIHTSTRNVCWVPRLQGSKSSPREELVTLQKMCLQRFWNVSKIKLSLFMVGAEMPSTSLAVYLAFSCWKTAWCGVSLYQKTPKRAAEAVTNPIREPLGWGKIRAHLLFLLANGEAFLMNSAASEEDESAWICMNYENVYLTATTTNGDQAG